LRNKGLGERIRLDVEGEKWATRGGLLEQRVIGRELQSHVRDCSIQSDSLLNMANLLGPLLCENIRFGPLDPECRHSNHEIALIETGGPVDGWVDDLRVDTSDTI
jgi:hypothetical protein